MFKLTNSPAEIDDMRKAFHRDIVVALVQHLRVTSWIEGHERIPAIMAAAGIEVATPEEIYNPDWSVADWDLQWEQIAGLDFAIYLDNMFQYGQFGLIDTGWEPMEEGTGYTWMSLVLMDMHGSQFLNDWSQGFSGEGADNIARCLQVAELANARLVLETGEPFCYQLSARERGDEMGVDGLTIRQVALLAGMEEMSVRAAANPKRANFLQTVSENGRTRITPEVAKGWLKSKARYVPIKSFNSGRNDDMRKRPFSNLAELVRIFQSRAYSFAVLHGHDLQVVDHRVLDFLETGENVFSDCAPWDPDQQRAALRDPVFVQALAEGLEMTPGMVSLRVRELLAKDELHQVQESLRQMSLPSGGEYE